MVGSYTERGEEQRNWRGGGGHGTITVGERGASSCLPVKGQSLGRQRSHASYSHTFGALPVAAMLFHQPFLLQNVKYIPIDSIHLLI